MNRPDEREVVLYGLRSEDEPMRGTLPNFQADGVLARHSRVSLRPTVSGPAKFTMANARCSFNSTMRIKEFTLSEP